MQEQQPNRFNPEDIGDGIIYASAGACILMIFIAGNAIAFAMTTAFLAAAGTIYVLYDARKTPVGRRVWNFMMKHPVITDITLSGLFAVLFGTATATGLLGGFAAGVIVSGALKLIKRYLPNGGLVDKSQIIKAPIAIEAEVTKEINYAA